MGISSSIHDNTSVNRPSVHTTYRTPTTPTPNTVHIQYDPKDRDSVLRALEGHEQAQSMVRNMDDQE